MCVRFHAQIANKYATFYAMLPAMSGAVTLLTQLKFKIQLTLLHSKFTAPHRAAELSCGCKLMAFSE